ncbi:Com family DNA-binding transcriptional regulator [Brucella intermedia]|uniref:Com family DNA-binding transcriptional regulator n=1 Tax=Brucella intermedia TaxID=94625 RepID=UPI003B633F80
MLQILTEIEMREIRCGTCQALLFKAGVGAVANDIHIKCRRCRTMNHLRPIEPLTDSRELLTEREDGEERSLASTAGQRARYSCR